MITRLTDFFGIGDAWVRPLPKQWLRTDLAIALAFTVGALLGLELARSMGLLGTHGGPLWAEYLALIAAGATLIWRRRYPITSMVLMAATMFVTGVTMGGVMTTFAAQITYLFGYYSVVAWGHPRRRMVAATALMVTFMFGWVTWQLVITDPPAVSERGTLDVKVATVIYSYFINLVFFGGAVLVGAISWREHRQRAALAAQADTIDDQARALQEQALVAERLRIARELHDVVAHHVSVIGVQAGAARRVLDRQPDAARDALSGIEASSRSAVAEMRSLLGTLRSDGDASRTPSPGFDDLGRLVEEYRAAGLEVDFRVVDGDPPLARRLPPGIGLSIYRTAQEALANVRRHSTARSAQVVVRIDRRDDDPYAEIEVLDAGRPRTDTRGTGLGQVGMRERVAAHGGEAEIGPRSTAGYRVRVRLPFQAS